MFSVVGAPQNWVFWIESLILSLSAIPVSKKVGKLWALAYFWIAWSALRVFEGHLTPFNSELQVWISALDLSSASALVVVLLVVFGTLYTPMYFLNLSLSVAMITNTLWIFFDKEGLFFNASMSGCFAALSFACANSLPTRLITGAATLYTCRHQPIGLFFLACWLRFKDLRFFISAMAVAMALCYFELIFNSNGRVPVWRDAFYFWEQFSPWLGTGLGTYTVIGPFLSIPKYGIGFIWMHSDWLQILFETGIPGLILVGLAYCNTLLHTRYTTIVLLFSFWMLANFPLHNPISAFFGALIIRTVFAEQGPIIREGSHKLHPNYQV